MGAGSGFFLILTQLTFFTKFSTLIMVSKMPAPLRLNESVGNLTRWLGMSSSQSRRRSRSRCVSRAIIAGISGLHSSESASNDRAGRLLHADARAAGAAGHLRRHAAALLPKVSRPSQYMHASVGRAELTSGAWADRVPLGDGPAAPTDGADPQAGKAEGQEPASA